MKFAPLHAISRVNVRIVVALSFLCALLAVGWMAWCLSGTPSYGPLRYTSRPPLSVPDSEWRGSENSGAAWATNSPFNSPYREARRAEAEAARAEAEAKQLREAEAQRLREAGPPPKSPALTPEAATPQPVPQPAPPLPEPPARMLTLTFRGTLTRTDGTTVAMVEQPTPGATLLLKVGDTIEGMTLIRLDRSSAILSPPGSTNEHALLPG